MFLWSEQFIVCFYGAVFVDDILLLISNVGEICPSLLDSSDKSSRERLNPVFFFSIGIW